MATAVPHRAVAIKSRNETGRTDVHTIIAAKSAHIHALAVRTRGRISHAYAHSHTRAHAHAPRAEHTHGAVCRFDALKLVELGRAI